MKIGYQGIENSNSEKAAEYLVKALELAEYELIPLSTSINVVNALEDGSVDAGVLAVNNNIGGVVEESRIALEGKVYKRLAQIKMPIHHAIFKADAEVNLADIDSICSHPQALKQCSEYLDEHFSSAERRSEADTAFAAKLLSEGELPRTAAVICRREAGEYYNLCLIADRIENAESITHFEFYVK